MVSVSSTAYSAPIAPSTVGLSKTAIAEPAVAAVAKSAIEAETTNDGRAISARFLDKLMDIHAGASQGAPGADAVKAVDSLLAASGSAIYGAAVKSLKVYPENLSTRHEQLVPDGVTYLSPADNAEALALSKARNAREEKPFFHFAHEAVRAATRPEMAGLMEQYHKAYIEYLDGLSPEEQNAERYRGTRPGSVMMQAAWASELGQPPEDLSQSRDPILMLFDKILANGANFNEDGARKVLADYKAGVATLISSQTDPQGNADKVQAASDRFMSVQNVIEQARKGDADALGWLQGLAKDPKTLDSFLSYAASLTTAETIAA